MKLGYIDRFANTLYTCLEVDIASNLVFFISDCKKEKQFYGYLAMKRKVWTYVDLLKTNKTAKHDLGQQ